MIKINVTKERLANNQPVLSFIVEYDGLVKTYEMYVSAETDKQFATIENFIKFNISRKIEKLVQEYVKNEQF